MIDFSGHVLVLLGFKALVPVSTTGAGAHAALGTGAGGWSYGKVTSALVDQINEACPNEGQVHVSGDDEEADREMNKHARDMSFHKRSPPDVVVYVCAACLASVATRACQVFAAAEHSGPQHSSGLRCVDLFYMHACRPRLAPWLLQPPLPSTSPVCGTVPVCWCICVLVYLCAAACVPL